jgi:hypothetical protein
MSFQLSIEMVRELSCHVEHISLDFAKPAPIAGFLMFEFDLHISANFAIGLLISRMNGLNRVSSC